MESFKQKLKNHIEHVKNVREHCTTEETTKQALILPFLDILGFNAYDPQKVKAEYAADFPGVKSGERVDYALFCQGVPVMFIEAKSCREKMDNHCPQLSRYFNSTPEVTISAITNGVEWRFFTDLKEKNIMDTTPFLRVVMDDISDADAEQLFRFRHDKFRPEALRTLAEESVYISSFTKIITASLKEVDVDFVRYVASHANIGRQLNQKFLESITPLVKQAVERSLSAMVVSGLSFTPAVEEVAQQPDPANEPVIDETADIIDPKNPNIVTTYNERVVFEKIQAIVGTDVDLHGKDTESYFSVLYQGKTNRWIARYHDKKLRSSIQLPIEFTPVIYNEISRAGLEADSNRIYLDSPEDILRIAGLILDSFQFVQNDENFKKHKA
ncbi:type I restriction endonuclease subunit R [Salmonella enterica subsp. enterica serovar Legon]|uniref:Type I restriction endonuclease subunit R n=1 Tax=Salmonella enterica subsp. enterica serovar Cardoner TaxID=2564309 RepID=A0A5W3RH14_SALET|nr:type I restriction endonuclease [Salmonella enterica]EBU8203413.1 type I restriction endonuclease subunit R [Salmonella enterica subsp. enterica serovar Cardoner]ECF2270980.1 type I restriction endonuclease subunit R [Salmonella enterica subsp. enterica serovar Durham]EAV9435630.1 type I restriction endonuclease subunit R [Salmonella enterica]EBW7241694.1 type I restriction endonuclease subunit R [Salmonella enterica subsp. enterica serovar Cardoner]EDS6805960.1 type I restriction endonucle